MTGVNKCVANKKERTVFENKGARQRIRTDLYRVQTSQESPAFRRGECQVHAKKLGIFKLPKKGNVPCLPIKIKKIRRRVLVEP